MSSSATQSAIIDFKNSLFKKVQDSKLAAFLRNSLVFESIDGITFFFLMVTVFSTAFFGSGKIGFFAILTVLCVLFKLFTKQGEELVFSKMDLAIFIFYAFAVLSLFGSTLFVASLHGFLKLVIYAAFYFCVSHFLKNNKGKTLPLLVLIATLVSFESIVGILQNFRGIEAISGWQDTQNLDATEVISRCYGTLKPYNPNLLAGYLLAGMSSIFYFGARNFTEHNKKRGVFFTVALGVCALALVLSGSRGGYLGLLAFAIVTLVGIYHYIKLFVGFKNIKKRYKNLVAVAGTGILVFMLGTPSIQKRILSIFAFREDSSISFRLNVYEASFRMFLDNFFIGIGIGNQNFREIYGLYMKTTYDALGAYSVPLEVAVETGILGFLAFSYFIFLAFKACVSFLKGKSSLKSKVLVMSILLTLTATMVHGLWDTVWYRPQVQILFWLNIAILNTLVLKPQVTKN